MNGHIRLILVDEEEGYVIESSLDGKQIHFRDTEEKHIDDLNQAINSALTQIKPNFLTLN